jgi:hypothetical protein
VSVRCFYEVIDRVSLAESGTYVYSTDCRYKMWGSDADPLVIEPVATGAAGLNETLAAWRARPVPLRGPLELRLGPSELVKYVIPGEVPEGPDDDPLRAVLDEPAADPKVRGGAVQGSFVAYLRQMVGGGGFRAGGDAALRDGATAF